MNVGDSRIVRSVVGADGTNEFQALTNDHKPDDPKETLRITQCGSTVLRKRVDASLAVGRAIGDHCFKKVVDITREAETLATLICAGEDVAAQAARGRAEGEEVDSLSRCGSIEIGGGKREADENPLPITKNEQGKKLFRVASCVYRAVTAVPEIDVYDRKDTDFVLLACDGYWDIFDSEQGGLLVKEVLKHCMAFSGCPKFVNDASANLDAAGESGTSTEAASDNGEGEGEGEGEEDGCRSQRKTETDDDLPSEYWEAFSLSQRLALVVRVLCNMAVQQGSTDNVSVTILAFKPQPEEHDKTTTSSQGEGWLWSLLKTQQAVTPVLTPNILSEGLVKRDTRFWAKMSTMLYDRVQRTPIDGSSEGELV